MDKDEPLDPKRPRRVECGCVVTPATGVYDVLCFDHRWMKHDPEMKRYAADADEEPRRG